MIRTFLKLKLYGILFVFFFLLLLPKVALWYQAEALMKKAEIILDGETANDTFIGLNLSHGTLYAQGLEVAKISQAEITAWLLYNRVTLSQVFGGKHVQMVQGLSIEQAEITHHIFAPLTLSITAQGTFGTLEGTISIATRRIELYITPTPQLRQNSLIVSQLQSTKEGYRFVTSF